MIPYHYFICLWMQGKKNEFLCWLLLFVVTLYSDCFYLMDHLLKDFLWKKKWVEAASHNLLHYCPWYRYCRTELWRLCPVLLPAVIGLWSAKALFLLSGICFHIFLCVGFWLFCLCYPVISNPAALLVLLDAFLFWYINVLFQESVPSVEN